jgi:2-phospho-L-lactate guanylyltransferase
MAAHVINVLRQTVDQTFMLTEEPVSEFADVTQLPDSAAGLNASLMRAARLLPHKAGDILIVIFPDLPLLAPADVTALIDACAGGVAIAADHHGTGTNAVALTAPGKFEFSFGAGSRRLHEEQAARNDLRAAVLHCDGLAFDIDDAELLHLCPAEFRSGASLSGLVSIPCHGEGELHI